MFRKLLGAIFITFAMATSVSAACNFKNTVSLKSLTASFDAWKSVTNAMAECGNFVAELDQEYSTKQPQAFSANLALYQIGGVSNSTIVPLLEQGIIRPLDSLVEKYGKHLKPNQLIKVDGKIMAIAITINAQHLMFRQDILDDLKIKPPRTYEQLLKAAAKIQKAGSVDYPLGGTYKTGWNLAQEFINMYLGLDGNLFGKGNRPTIVNKQGEKALKIMKALTKYMDPKYLVSDSTYVQKQFQQGKIAMANLWATNAKAMDNNEESKVVGQVTMIAAPAAKRNGNSATTLWWDSIVIAKNITDKEAEFAFRVAMEGIDKEMLSVEENNNAAVWLIDGYMPNRLSKGVIESVAAKAPPYPISGAMLILHTALGNNIADYLTDKKSVRNTLKTIANEYRVLAKEKGIM